MATRGTAFAVAVAIVIAAAPPAHAQAPVESADAVTESAQVPPARADEAGDHGGAVRHDTAPAPAAAEPATRPHWQPHWRRFHLLEGVMALAAEGIALGAYLATPRSGAMWTSPGPLDGEIRALVRLHDRSGRELAQDISDVLLQVSIYYPIVIDAFLLAGLVHQDWDTMLQMALIDAAAMAFGNLITAVTTRFVGRERPSAQACREDPQYMRGCEDEGVGPITSFVSGHALTQFLASGLVCSHHLNHPWLTGGPEGAAIACGSALVLAAAGSTMRVMSDLHWASDVVIGAMVGSLIGFGLPLALHYRPAPRDGVVRAPGESGPIWITAIPSYDGDHGRLDVVGAF